MEKRIILYVDDDPLLRTSIGKIIYDKFKDYTVITANSADAAKKIIFDKSLEGKLAAVVTDLQMPSEIEGLDVVKAAVEKNVPVIVYSSLDQRLGLDKLAVANGAIGAIVKLPGQYEILFNYIIVALNGSRED